MKQYDDCILVGCLLFADAINWVAGRYCQSLEGAWRGLCVMLLFHETK